MLLAVNTDMIWGSGLAVTKIFSHERLGSCAELAEAERLEREAMLRRERAVAHGAHPDNRHLGGQPGAGALNERQGNM